MTPALLAGTVALMLGQTSWQAGLRGETRVFEDAAGDLLLRPELAVEYGARSLLLQASYAPDLLLREPRGRGTFNALQRGDALATWTVERDTRLELRQGVAAGAADLSWLGSPPDAALSSSTRRIGSELVDSLDTTSSLSIAEQLARNVSTTATARFSVSGGVGDTAQVALPSTRTAQFEASGAWIDRRDALTLRLGGSRGWVSNGRLTTSWNGVAGWRHALSAASRQALTGEPVAHLGERPPPRYELEVAAGASVMGGDRNERHDVVPTASFTLRRDEPVRRPGAIAGRVTLRYAPVVDPLSGALAPRAEASVALDLRLMRDVVAIARGGAGRTVDVTPAEPLLGQAAAGLAYEPLPNLTITAEMRVARLPHTEWAAVVTTTLSQRGHL